MIFSWLEVLACLLVALPLRPRTWRIPGLIGVAAVWIFGTAGVLLGPSILAALMALALHKHPKTCNLIALTGATASIALCLLFPLPAAPPLSGPHAVGTRTFEVPAEESYSALVVQIWYPTRDTSGPKAPWLPDPALAPGVPLHRIAHASSRSVANAIIKDSPQPWRVIFYEHSWMGHRAENIAQVEDLASEGFVVVAIDHPGQASRVRYADGSVIPGQLPGNVDLSTKDAVEAFKALADLSLIRRQTEVARVIKFLTKDGLGKNLRLNDLGVFGFSFGGTTALRLCETDSLFKAGADEDGFFVDELQPRGSFYFFDDEMPAWLRSPATSNEGTEQAFIRTSEQHIQSALNQAGRYRLFLGGTRHESFTDRIFFSRIPFLAKAGKRPAGELHRTLTTTLADFFKRELK